MADKIDQIQINNDLWDIDLPADATPSIASLTTSGNITEAGTLLKNKYDYRGFSYDTIMLGTSYYTVSYTNNRTKWLIYTDKWTKFYNLLDYCKNHQRDIKNIWGTFNIGSQTVKVPMQYTLITLASEAESAKLVGQFPFENDFYNANTITIEQSDQSINLMGRNLTSSTYTLFRVELEISYTHPDYSPM